MISIMFAAMVVYERKRLPNPVLPALFVCLGLILSAAEGLR